VQYIYQLDRLRGGLQLLLVVNNKRHLQRHAHNLQHVHQLERLRGRLQLLLVLDDKRHLQRHADILQHVHQLERLRGRLQLHLEHYQHHVHGHGNTLQPTLIEPMFQPKRLHDQHDGRQYAVGRGRSLQGARPRSRIGHFDALLRFAAGGYTAGGVTHPIPGAWIGRPPDASVSNQTNRKAEVIRLTIIC
jgi:hypothetical protein